VGRTRTYAFLIYMQKELIVRAHVNHEMLRRFLKLDHFSKMKYKHVAVGTIRPRNPFRRPEFTYQIGIKTIAVGRTRVRLRGQKSAIRDEQEQEEERRNRTLHSH